MGTTDATEDAVLGGGSGSGAAAESEEATEDGGVGGGGGTAAAAAAGGSATEDEGEATEDEGVGAPGRPRESLGALALYSGQSMTPKVYAEWDHIICTDADMRAEDIPVPNRRGKGRGRGYKRAVTPGPHLFWQETDLAFEGATRRAFMLARDPADPERGPKPSLLRVLKLTHRALGENVITRHVRALGHVGVMGPEGLLAKDVMWSGNPNFPCQVLFSLGDVKVWWSLDRVPGMHAGMGSAGLRQERLPVLKTSRTWKGAAPPSRKDRRAVTDVALENMGSRRLLKFWPGPGVFTVVGCLWHNQLMLWEKVFPPGEKGYSPPPLAALVAPAVAPGDAGAGSDQGDGDSDTQDSDGQQASPRGKKRERDTEGTLLRGRVVPALDRGGRAGGRPLPGGGLPAWPEQWQDLQVMGQAARPPLAEDVPRPPLSGLDVGALADACGTAAGNLAAAVQALDGASGAIMNESLGARMDSLEKLKAGLGHGVGGLEAAWSLLQSDTADLDAKLEGVLEVRRCLAVANLLAEMAGKRLGSWASLSRPPLGD